MWPGGCMARRVCMVGGMHGQGGVNGGGWGHAWWGSMHGGGCMVGGHAWQGGGMCGRGVMRDMHTPPADTMAMAYG